MFNFSLLWCYILIEFCLLVSIMTRMLKLFFSHLAGYRLDIVCFKCVKSPIRGYSSAGRALAWHARGRRFDPA